MSDIDQAGQDWVNSLCQDPSNIELRQGRIEGFKAGAQYRQKRIDDLIAKLAIKEDEITDFYMLQNEWEKELKHQAAQSELEGIIGELVEPQIGSWMSAALDDPNVCDAMKADIRAWFDTLTRARKKLEG